MVRIYLNIGSNLGDRKSNIQLAIDKISALFGPVKTSSLVESKPWGFDSTNNFFNVGVMIESQEDPHSIFRRLQKIEKDISPLSHRNADGSYADRLIDIDIMAIDEKIIDTQDLKIPHPHLMERDFFLKPLLELAPEWKNPLPDNK